MLFDLLIKTGRNIVHQIESTSIAKLWAASKNQITKQCSSEVVEDLPDVIKSLSKRDQSINNKPERTQQRWFNNGQEMGPMNNSGKGATLNWLIKLGSNKFNNLSVKSIELPERRMLLDY